MLVPNSSKDVKELTEEQAKKLLSILIEKLDDADMDDMLGTEGWRHYFGLED